MTHVAHGIVGRSDLPIPEWLFGWAAAVVLVVSFVALAVLWPEPKLARVRERALPALSRVVLSRPVDLLCGAVGVFLFGLVLYAGFDGTETVTANFAPTFVYVIFWLGLVLASVLLGNVYRAFNPWRAIGRTVSWVARTAARTDMPAPLAYPERLGHWPAVAGIFLFATLELVVSGGDTPRTVAIAALVYSVGQFVGMALYGVEEWTERGDGFAVYFSLFARISPWTVKDGAVRLRVPLAGLAELRPLAGTVALLAVMIGTVTFDGAAESALWTGIAPDLADTFESIGLSPARALELTFLIGLAATCLIVGGFYMLGARGAQSVGGGFTTEQLARAFVASLVPIAFAYVAAHYMTLLLYQGQAIVILDWPPFGYLSSNPLGSPDTDIFGTAGRAIDYGVISATAAWYWMVGFVVAGHVAALTLAHDKALTIYSDVKLAVRSQYWMLAVMVGFTSLALWLLSQSNQ
ncbi:MAG: fenitrothion hydrolase [Solirubrobacterales bacterium]|nr:fenitrothion hydrolase [Solirubrobacterales bacterium]